MQMNMYIEVKGFQTCFYSPGHLFLTLPNNQTVSLSYTKILFLAATIQNIGLWETVLVWYSISVLIHRVYWIGLCVCKDVQKKMLWAMKLLDLVVWTCFLSYLEWTYDSRCNRVTKVFDRILEDQWKWWKGIMIFNVQQSRVVCRPMKIFVSSWWDCWIWWSKFVFLLILSELTIQGVIGLCRFLREF
jgi:hypothetical protein